MKLFACAISAASLAAIAVPAIAGQTVSKPVVAALANPDRPADQRAIDGRRKAGEILTFAGIRPGDRVADFVMGGGYWTRILSPLVGPKGKVYAYQPAEFIKFQPSYAEQQRAAVAGLSNAVAKDESFGALAFPERLDAIVTVQNYHDLFLKPFPRTLAADVTKKLFDALKPGGVLLVVDHVAASDPDNVAPDKLHRIDPAIARAAIEQAGFRFAGKLDVLRNPDDPHGASVFDPSIRGKTDQFIYKFVKPKR
ncbi:methyltransferase [Sphingomonas sp.]|uniref:class I SAM-dependent methyltransferase n=1 Tax=Sphingomonas sp. TaxID=28214 RepID=UPI001EBDA9CD|nr:methyltransferase [Sphingomonas sp.]MBX3595676.1 class I SAM-dependent methyltransferase [Sphingomonas sp.]